MDMILPLESESTRSEITDVLARKRMTCATVSLVATRFSELTAAQQLDLASTATLAGVTGCHGYVVIRTKRNATAFSTASALSSV